MRRYPLTMYKQSAKYKAPMTQDPSRSQYKLKLYSNCIYREEEKGYGPCGNLSTTLSTQRENATAQGPWRLRYLTHVNPTC